MQFHVHIDALIAAFRAAVNLLRVNIIAEVLILLLKFTFEEQDFASTNIQTFRIRAFYCNISVDSQSEGLSVAGVFKSLFATVKTNGILARHTKCINAEPRNRITLNLKEKISF